MSCISRPASAIGMAPRPIRRWGISRSPPLAVNPLTDGLGKAAVVVGGDCSGISPRRCRARGRRLAVTEPVAPCLGTRLRLANHRSRPYGLIGERLLQKFERRSLAAYS